MKNPMDVGHPKKLDPWDADPACSCGIIGWICSIVALYMALKLKIKIFLEKSFLLEHGTKGAEVEQYQGLCGVPGWWNKPEHLEQI